MVTAHVLVDNSQIALEVPRGFEKCFGLVTRVLILAVGLDSMAAWS